MMITKMVRAMEAATKAMTTMMEAIMKPLEGPPKVPMTRISIHPITAIKDQIAVERSLKTVKLFMARATAAISNLLSITKV